MSMTAQAMDRQTIERIVREIVASKLLATDGDAASGGQRFGAALSI